MAVVPSVAAGTSGINTELRYPKADLSQQEVIADKMVFAQALKRLHEEMGTQYRVPQVSGRELDLFLLYKQVTHLGGLEAVITSKKWSDVSVPFQFPASFTSKSFTLRKMYSKLLFDFEQVYLHRNTGPMSAPPGMEPYIKAELGTVASSNMSKRRRMDAPQREMPIHHAGVPIPLTAFHQGASIPPGTSLVGQPLTGHVDAKFDHGYFVSVNVDRHAFRGALYVPPAVPAADLHSNPKDRHVQANESNSPADESTPEPCEVYQVHATAAEGSRTIPMHSIQLRQQVGHTSSQQSLPQPAHAATGCQEKNQFLQQPAVQLAPPRQEDWKVLLAQGWSHAPTPQQRQAHAATPQVDDIGRPAECRRQQAEARLAPDDIFRSQEVFASQQAACAQSAMPAAYPAPPRHQHPPFASLASQEHEAADRPGLRQEALGEAVTLFPSQRHQLNQQQQQLPARYMPPTQQRDMSCRLDGASLQQLLHMADQQQVPTSHQLALLHSLQPNMPGHVVSGQAPVAMPRMQPPSLMPSPPPPWLVEQRPHSQVPAGQLNVASIAVGNHAFPYTLDSSQRQSAGLLRVSQTDVQERNQQCFKGSSHTYSGAS
ncbi:hypothetical protein WJX77_004142 [Trebouxia sp. C0004]